MSNEKSKCCNAIPNNNFGKKKTCFVCNKPFVPAQVGKEECKCERYKLPEGGWGEYICSKHKKSEERKDFTYSVMPSTPQKMKKEEGKCKNCGEFNWRYDNPCLDHFSTPQDNWEEEFEQIRNCGTECGDWHGVCPDNIKAFIRLEKQKSYKEGENANYLAYTKNTYNEIRTQLLQELEAEIESKWRSDRISHKFREGMLFCLDIIKSKYLLDSLKKK